MANDMKVKIRIGKKYRDHSDNKQTVNFIYCYDKQDVESGIFSTKKDYAEVIHENENKSVILCQNYTQNESILQHEPVGIATVGKGGFDRVSVYRREIWQNGGESIREPVVLDYKEDKLIDFNISNNRIYQYSIYPYTSAIGSMFEYSVQNFVTETHWDFYSITELHPISGSKNKFTASDDDVWIFKYNVEFSDQKQNISKNKQDTLGKYPKFSSGSTNYLEGSFKALIGSQMIKPNLKYTKAVPVIENNELVWEDEYIQDGVREDGYHEGVSFNNRLSSNEKIDMLNQWRSVCYSGNPKLLKDLKGQKILIQITDPGNSSNPNLNKIPDTISFQWTQIGDADNIEIIGK